ncbi:hypothetical protein [Aminobacter ciceronei]|uniref:Uncharacterized protein n=1 Tax=Aminobacter ciceronei TaxID=150723 RepID=A0ABR6C0V1_9HYPH|nr:hypothetical protein [Aminobacter ciceronei]MBA8904853.1 hypothetical protein [Aminobacter ciceronei]MBA9018593.1 hypothetical protein [Aminobacter ciceronei]
MAGTKHTAETVNLAPVKHWSMATAIEQVEKCAFECEGGPLANNDAWRWLVGAAKIGPEFWPGQGVFFEITAEASGKTLKQWVHFYIVGCHMDSDTDRRYWTYDLSYDPPAPWHYGTVHVQRIRGDRLRLEKPGSLTEGSSHA